MFAFIPSQQLRMAAVAATMIVAMQSASAEDLIRVGMIPGSGATTGSVEDQKVLQSYLSDILGVSVKLVVPKDYNATLEGLGNGSFDFAILGAVGYVKAHEKLSHWFSATSTSNSIASSSPSRVRRSTRWATSRASALPSVTWSRRVATSCPIARWSRPESIREKTSNGRALRGVTPPP
jgi:hypothetical protein